MAKLKGPLMSLDARGAVGPRLTYSSRKSGSQVRFQRIKIDPKTEDQQTQRGWFDEALGKWNTLSDADKALWDKFNRE